MAEQRFRGAVLAPWWKRVFVTLFDSASVDVAATLATIGLLPMAVLGRYWPAVTSVFFLGIAVVVMGYSIWNQVVLRGQTGRSLGSRVLYLRLVSERDGRPIGGWTCLGRGISHIVDALPLGLGFLMPLFSKKRQTFADMIFHTIVVVDDRPVPPHVTSFRRPRPQAPDPVGVHAEPYVLDLNAPPASPPPWLSN